MEFLYHVLGVAARFNESGSRFRVNFIPINWAAIFVLGVASLGCLAASISGWTNGTTPRTARLVDVLAHKDLDHNFVTVDGLLMPQPQLQQTYRSSSSSSSSSSDSDESSSSSSSLEHTWVPLLDGSGKKGILVQIKVPPGEDDKPRVVTLTGSVNPMDSRLAEHLQKDPIKEFQLDNEYVLEEGDGPPNPLLMTAIGVGVGALFLALVFTAATNGIVFRETPEANVWTRAVPPDQSLVRYSGYLTLDQHHRRFLDMPAGTGLGEHGERYFVSNIDASSRLYGFVTERRDGYWSSGITPGTVSRMRVGYQYVGSSRRPALRFCYRELNHGGFADTILAFETEDERAAMHSALMAGSAPPGGLSPPQEQHPREPPTL